MSKHLQEYEIDLLITSADNIAESDQKKYLAHLEGCALCREHLQTAKEFYADLDERLEKDSTEKDAILANRISKSKSAVQISLISADRGLEIIKKPKGEFIEFKEVKPNIARRMVNLAVQYPVRAASGVGLIAAALLLMMYITKSPVSKSNPDYAKVQDAVLTVYDKHGNALWQKDATGMPEGSTLTVFRDETGVRINSKPILIKDVHPMQGKEVLVSGLPRVKYITARYSDDTLYCFSATGDLLWSRSYSIKEYKQYRKQRGGQWKISGMFTINSNSEGKKEERLFVSVTNVPYAPTTILELDGLTGTELQGYVHFGNIAFSIPQYIPEKNKTRIIISGINNGFNRAFVASLDPDLLSGFGPGIKDYSTDAPIDTAREIYYLLFPRSQIGQSFSNSLYNATRDLWVNPDGTIIVEVMEFPGGQDEMQGSILYTLDSDLRIKSVTFEDSFLKTYEQLATAKALLDKQGKTIEPLNSSYAETLKKSVLYWDGEKFLSTPTQNRRYLKGINIH